MQSNPQQALGPDYNPRGELKLYSIFNSIQGEGPFAGRPATFVRLFGCNLTCGFCDTDYTSKHEHVALAEAVTRIMTRAMKHNNKLIVITGGEPFRQNITPLANRLLEMGYEIQVETNGSLYDAEFPYDHEHVFIVCSPKTSRLPMSARTACKQWFFKYIVGEGTPLNAAGLPLGVAAPPEAFPARAVYIQPLDAANPLSNARNRACAVRVVQEHGYTLSLQLHKILEVE